MVAKATLAMFVTALLKSGKLPYTARQMPRNRAEARKHLKAHGPFQHFPGPGRISGRRVSTRQKRAEQRERAGGR